MLSVFDGLVARVLAFATLCGVALLGLAVPAGASPASGAVLAAERFWFYWLAPLLALGSVGAALFLGVGYYVRVIRPRSRGRRVT